MRSWGHCRRICPESYHHRRWPPNRAYQYHHLQVPLLVLTPQQPAAVTEEAASAQSRSGSEEAGGRRGDHLPLRSYLKKMMTMATEAVGGDRSQTACAPTLQQMQLLAGAAWMWSRADFLTCRCH